MRRLITEAYLLLGEKDRGVATDDEPEGDAEAPSDPTDAKKNAKDANASKSREKSAEYKAKHDDSANAVVARVKRMRARYDARAREQEKVAPSIAKATKDAQGRDLFQSNPNSTPRHSPVTDLTKGW